MPSGWITEENYTQSVFDLSPFKTRKLAHYKEPGQMSNKDYFRRAVKTSLSLEYVLFTIWATIELTSHTQHLTLLPRYEMNWLMDPSLTSKEIYPGRQPF